MEEAHMETLRGRMKQELGRLAAAPLERVDVSDHVRSVYYQHRLSSNMATQQKAIRLAYRQEAIRREELLEAGKEEKMFVKLRERQKVRYLKELDSRNQKETDETAKNVFLKGKTS
jgi:flagellar biosynthesis chaperone FliJ